MSVLSKHTAWIYSAIRAFLWNIKSISVAIFGWAVMSVSRLTTLTLFQICILPCGCVVAKQARRESLYIYMTSAMFVHNTVASLFI